MQRPKKMSKSKFVRICVAEGLPRDVATNLYWHFEVKRKVILTDLPSTEEWLRQTARAASQESK